VPSEASPERPLQRVEVASRPTVSSPTRRIRLEVDVPFRVLSGSEVASALGCSLPVRPRRSRKRPTLPVFLPLPVPKDATPWVILSWGSAPLHGLSRSSRPRPLDRGHLSWGSGSPTTHQEKRVHVPPLVTVGLPWWCQGSAVGSHPAGYGAVLGLSQPLDDLVPLSAAPPFSDG
jgi:hypothetical protein